MPVNLLNDDSDITARTNSSLLTYGEHYLQQLESEQRPAAAELVNKEACCQLHRCRFGIKVLGVIFHQLLLSSGDKLFLFIVNKLKQMCLKSDPHQSVDSLAVSTYTNATRSGAELNVDLSPLQQEIL